MKDRIAEDKVVKATGHGWDHWFGVLNSFAVQGYDHTSAAKHLVEKHGVSMWYAQTITIQYEQERGLRGKRQKTSGEFECSVSRTISAPLASCWNAWANAEDLSAWMNCQHQQEFVVAGRYSNSDGDMGEFTIIEPMQRIRFTWEHPNHKPGSRVTIEFSEKEDARTLVRLVHGRLADTAEADDLSKAWGQMMDQLKAWLER